MNGREMLINSLVKALGLDKTLAENVSYAVDKIAAFETRLARCERLLEFIASQYGDIDHVGQTATSAGRPAEHARGDNEPHSVAGNANGAGTGILPASE